ncbi:MAG: hypothetical protein MJ231_09245 [bacterium]|nr:hypothetical protein [bacterium]
MKKFFTFISLIMCLFILCSCSIETTTNNTDNYDDEEIKYTSSEELTCDDLGHDYQKGVCTRCGEFVEVDMNQRVGKPSVLNFNTNSANGINFRWEAKNISGKTIKYCIVLIKFENAVGDPAYDEINGNDFCKCRITGPFNPNEEFCLWDDVIGYSADCSKVTVDQITLEYADGSYETGTYGWYYSKY